MISLQLTISGSWGRGGEERGERGEREGLLLVLLFPSGWLNRQTDRQIIDNRQMHLLIDSV